MAGYDRPWAVAGGWAIDLFVGRQTRPHADVDLATLRVDQAELRAHLTGASIRKVRDHQLSDWLPGETLVLPVHEVHATWPDGSSVEFLLNESGPVESPSARPTQWVFRRDSRVTMSFDRAIQRRDDVPFLVPEIVLLYKSNDLSPRNESDLATVVGIMTAEQRRWLHDAISLGAPGHGWLPVLRED
jgi:hypothetical protein